MIVARCLRTLAARQRRACGAICSGRTGRVRLMWHFPLTRLVVQLSRRSIDDMVQPAMPRWRHAASVGIPLVNDPAPLKTKGWIDGTAAGAIVAATLLVLSDQLSKPPGPELCSEGLSIPPGEEFEEELFHMTKALRERRFDVIMEGNCPVEGRQLSPVMSWIQRLVSTPKQRRRRMVIVDRC